MKRAAQTAMQTPGGGAGSSPQPSFAPTSLAVAAGPAPPAPVASRQSPRIASAAARAAVPGVPLVQAVPLRQRPPTTPPAASTALAQQQQQQHQQQQQGHVTHTAVWQFPGPAAAPADQQSTAAAAAWQLAVGPRGPFQSLPVAPAVFNPSAPYVFQAQQQPQQAQQQYQPQPQHWYTVAGAIGGQQLQMFQYASVPQQPQQQVQQQQPQQHATAYAGMTPTTLTPFLHSVPVEEGQLLGGLAQGQMAQGSASMPAGR